MKIKYEIDDNIKLRVKIYHYYIVNINSLNHIFLFVSNNNYTVR